MKTVARLYEQFQPNHYEVSFDIDEAALRFTGTVTVRGKKVGRPSKRLTFHQDGLTCIAATVVKHDKKGDQTVAVSRINKQQSFHELRLHSEQLLYPGEYTVTMSFEAPINDGMTGIYPCYYKDGSEEKKLFATQFESHHARQAFPCIDEPEAKATFDLTLITKGGVTALANMPVKAQSNQGDRAQTTFETTPKMSSYLLAFVYGELQSKETTTSRGTVVRSWATTAQPADSLNFSLDVAKRSIEFFEDYFGTDYPLPKMDHAALPDFSSAAMENWGLVTYREQYLLAYPDEISQELKERIAVVIAHETSHQWFGNLVTMRWWNDLWLNESFANMMEYQCIDALFPEWSIWNEFISGEALSALRRDAVAGVQSVKSEVNHPDEISSLFDPSIVYAKGGRLLYMLKSYIGEEAFRGGLSDYFKQHAYSNTEGSDLWKALGASSGIDVAAFMDPWLTRSGFPLVHIEQSNDTIKISQEHFQDDPSKADGSRLWPVPLFADAPKLPNSFDAKNISAKSEHDNVLIDTGARGHYLVHYVGDRQKQYLLSMIADASLPEADRLMLLNGSSMMARAGYEPYADVLTMLHAYAQESSQAVWDIMALIIAEARRFIDASPELEPAIKSFVSKLVSAQVDRLGWNEKLGESSADTKLRIMALSLSAYAEDTLTVDYATKLFEQYKHDSKSVPAELRALCFVVPIKNGDDTAFDYLMKLHDTTTSSELKSDIAGALTSTRDPKRALELLARMKDPKIIKPQDLDHWLVYLIRNRYVRDVAWDWLVTNWSWLEDLYKQDKSYDNLPRYAASCVNSREYEQKFNDLFAAKADQIALKRNIEMGQAEIASRLAWLERDAEGVKKFFS